MLALALRAVVLCAAGTLLAKPLAPHSLSLQDPGDVSSHADEQELAKRLRGLLAAEHLEVEVLAKGLGLGVPSGIDAGFGARIRRRLELPVGEGVLRVDLLTGRDANGVARVARAHFRLRSRYGASEEQRRALCEDVLAGWPGPMTADRGGPLLFAHWRDAEIVGPLEAAKARVLGPMPLVEIPASLARDLEVLTMGFEQLTFGGGCGITGLPAPGRMEADRLAEAGRFDLLRVALRGWDPVGRAYAAEALLSHDQADFHDHATIRAIRDEIIPVCDGCAGGKATVGEILDRLPGR